MVSPILATASPATPLWMGATPRRTHPTTAPPQPTSLGPPSKVCLGLLFFQMCCCHHPGHFSPFSSHFFPFSLLLASFFFSCIPGYSAFTSFPSKAVAPPASDLSSPLDLGNCLLLLLSLFHSHPAVSR